jgi:uncharacterized membrane protein YkoI
LFKRRSEQVAHKVNMKTTKAFLAIIAATVTLAIAAPAHAGRGLVPGPMTENGRMSLMQIATTLVPLSQVLETINAQEPGNQLDTNTVIENGRTIYVVRWQASRGRIIIFRVDAETGQIIGRQG